MTPTTRATSTGTSETTSEAGSVLQIHLAKFLDSDNTVQVREEGDRLVITRVRPEDKGVYRCYARNRNSRDFQQVGHHSQLTHHSQQTATIRDWIHVIGWNLRRENLNVNMSGTFLPEVPAGRKPCVRPRLLTLRDTSEPRYQ